MKPVPIGTKVRSQDGLRTGTVVSRMAKVGRVQTVEWDGAEHLLNMFDWWSPDLIRKHIIAPESARAAQP